MAKRCGVFVMANTRIVYCLYTKKSGNLTIIYNKR